MIVLASLCACALVLGIAARPASAIIVHLSNGKYLSYDAAIGASVPGKLAKPSPSIRDSIFHNLDYSGGPVMPSNNNYVIAWTPHGYTGAPFQDKGFDSGAASWPNDTLGYINGVAQFFKDLQTASAAHSTAVSDAVSVQYNDGQGHTAAFNSTYGGGGTGPNGAWLDTDSVPGGGSGCPWSATNTDGGDAKGSGGFCVTDAQIQTELNNFLTAHNLPRGMTNEYFLLTPPDVVTCFDSAGSKGECSANSADQNSRAFCGYHTSSSVGSPIIYANIPDSSGTTTNPDPDGLYGCDPYVTNAKCGAGGLYFCDYNTMAGGVLSAVSHEHNESITDPQPNNAWTDYEQNPPYQGGTEIGDLCNDDAGADSDGTQYVEQNNFHYYPYNETIGPDTYWIQGEWSNEYRKCLFGGTFLAPPGSSFIVSGENGSTVHFNAGGSCGNISGIESGCNFPITEYTWQFNDDVKPGDSPQEFTVSCPAAGGGAPGCNGALMSHTFPKPGTYTVALTTQNTDGRSWGSALNVHVYASPGPRISVHGSGLAGAPVSFSSAGTTHDPSTSITHYSWHFGDGGTSTSANPAHTYAHSGVYLVTLTVTDSRNATGSTGGHLTVSASCRVPNVTGKSLSAAKSAISAARCATGSVTKPSKKRKHKKLVVKSQSPTAGGLVRAGTKVNLTLRYK